MSLLDASENQGVVNGMPAAAPTAVPARVVAPMLAKPDGGRLPEAPATQSPIPTRGARRSGVDGEHSRAGSACPSVDHHLRSAARPQTARPARVRPRSRLLYRTKNWMCPRQHSRECLTAGCPQVATVSHRTPLRNRQHCENYGTSRNLRLKTMHYWMVTVYVGSKPIGVHAAGRPQLTEFRRQPSVPPDRFT